ncbi:hypothetical protein RSOLAG1IB_12656 [Rhizoctonia solani AG-1 IB]|uniref:Uncharacterized protein n=1 Tax=Thanatephorus cucumeris (strain AG1-IB / isolate 7/3/14) TaxID=1108050 RepID=A0A0B7G0A7_THACB|nr:hypothetical protein RSOLAG1IB_12656 [Rhizoctonia solani AG-1 IB]
MDSTSHRNINFSSMHIMANSPSSHNQLYLGVESTTDHTSQTQVNVLKQTLDTICSAAKRAPKCESGPTALSSTPDIARKLYGVNGDHASDQLKVAQLEKEWKIDSWIEHLGNKALLDLGDSDSKLFYDSIKKAAETEAGGSDVFSSLHLANQEDLLASEYQKSVWALGKAEFDKAEPSLKEDMTCMVCGGCCAHKDMNATKGGATAMLAFWKANNHLSPPVKLFNKDNDAAMLLSDPSGKIMEVEQRAITVTDAGAIKLCSLAGAAYHHKDDKKGHQDTHVYWFAHNYNQFQCFPDTSNVRYSSYIDAATELCTFHGAYIQYMEHIRRQKVSGALNHLESNIVKALNCPATLAELLSIALYGQIISKPYIRLVRAATVAGTGLADLASLHASVQSHLKSIISNPALVLGLESPETSATLDGLSWDNTDVFKALKDHGPKLPYLSELFVAYCQGALQTWARFTNEFSPGGPISLLTTEQKTKAYMPSTNDANEGALGTWRVWARRFPSLTLHKFNAIAMNRANQAEAYIDSNFTLKQHKWIRAEARQIDSSRLEANRKSKIVDAQADIAKKNEATRSQRTERRNKREEYVAGIKLVLDPEAIRKLTGKELEDQLKVYKKTVVLSSGQTFPAVSKMNVAEKKRMVIGLAERYVSEMALEETNASSV